MSLGDMIKGVGDFIEDNPWTLALAAGPMGAAAGAGISSTAIGAAIPEAAALGGVALPATAAAGMGGALGSGFVAPQAMMAGITPAMASGAIPAAGAVAPAAGMGGALGGGISAGALNSAVPMAASLGGAGLGTGMSTQDLMQAYGLLNSGGQQQRPMPRPPAGRPIYGQQPMQPFRQYAPQGLPPAQRRSAAGRFSGLIGGMI